MYANMDACTLPREEPQTLIGRLEQYEQNIYMESTRPRNRHGIVQLIGSHSVEQRKHYQSTHQLLRLVVYTKVVLEKEGHATSVYEYCIWRYECYRAILMM